jgi:hypothetical protein
MYAIRRASSNDRVTQGDFYDVDVGANGNLRIVDNNGRKMHIAPNPTFWWVTEAPNRRTDPAYKECYESYQQAQLNVDADLHNWARQFEREERARKLKPHIDQWDRVTISENSDQQKAEQLTKKAPTMTQPIKIEDTKIIDGKLLTDHTPESIIHLIQKERTALDAINALKIASKYVAKVRAIHTENIEKLVGILDTFAEDDADQA